MILTIQIVFLSYFKKSLALWISFSIICGRFALGSSFFVSLVLKQFCTLNTSQKKKFKCTKCKLIFSNFIILYQNIIFKSSFTWFIFITIPISLQLSKRHWNKKTSIQRSKKSYCSCRGTRRNKWSKSPSRCRPLLWKFHLPLLVLCVLLANLWLGKDRQVLLKMTILIG